MDISPKRVREQNVKRIIEHSFIESGHWRDLAKVFLQTANPPKPPKPQNPENPPEPPNPQQLKKWDYEKGSNGPVSLVVDRSLEMLDNLLAADQDGKSALPMEITCGKSAVTLLFAIPIELPHKEDKKTKREGDFWKKTNLNVSQKENTKEANTELNPSESPSSKVMALKESLKKKKTKLIFFAVALSPSPYIKELIAKQGRFVPFSTDLQGGSTDLEKEKFKDLLEGILTEETADGAYIKTIFLSDRLSAVHAANLEFLLAMEEELKSASGPSELL